MDLQPIVEAIASNMFWVGVTLIACAAILAGAIKSLIHNASFERSRREIAAYIAEGSMTPEQGERILNAGPKSDE